MRGIGRVSAERQSEAAVYFVQKAALAEIPRCGLDVVMGANFVRTKGTGEHYFRQEVEK